MGLIFFLSSKSQLPHVTPPGFPPLEAAIGHFTVYAVLAVLLWWALRGAGVRHPFAWALFAALLYGASDEFHQSFVPNRNPDTFDLATDLAGAATALLIVRWWSGLRRRVAPAADAQGDFIVQAPPSLATEVVPQGRGGAATSTYVDYDRAT
jgi:VanZ family protein